LIIWKVNFTIEDHKVSRHGSDVVGLCWVGWVSRNCLDCIDNDEKQKGTEEISKRLETKAVHIPPEM